MFFGRKDELKRLTVLKNKKTASLVVVKGRRRIGKSTLIEKFGEQFETFIEIQGLSPEEKINSQDQRNNFSEQLKSNTGLPSFKLDTWTDALTLLASQVKIGRTLILLDEISWMAHRSKDFAGKLKIAWDTQFKKNNQLIMVLCGSVSSWIDKNILNDADFVGRVSLTIDLNELPLNECNNFWGNKKDRLSSFEKLKILSVTGGVPKYLEEINIGISAEENIKNMCFDQGGILFDEFNKIFKSTFDTRAIKYREIVKYIAQNNCSIGEIADALSLHPNRDLSEYLKDLESSGFLSRDFVYNFTGKASKLSKYRIKDNYIRFFLRYIEPVQDRVKKGMYKYSGFSSLQNWSVLLGLQFENLVINNLPYVVERIGIDKGSIISASPYFQNKTKIQPGCQIDLLIQTKFNTLYICEIKFRNKISIDVIKEVQTKIDRLKRPKYYSIRPVLICEGEIESSVKTCDFFDSIITFRDLLEN